MIERALKLPVAGTETFFLWGPRQTGKSTLLRSSYPTALWIDLLKADEYRRYLQQPELLRQEIAMMASPPFVVIDEVQRVPSLLEEVHWLHEQRGVHFALCGSSPRKVRHGQANLLGGRAIRYSLGGLTARELGPDFDLTRLLNHGYLPRIYLSDRPQRLQRSYAAEYLREEIAAEGLVRNLPGFSAFLDLAALSDCEQVNYSTIARDCGVSSQTVKGHFDILVDTLVGSWLPSYRVRPKRRMDASPKFYFRDVGVVNFLARRGSVEPGSELFGKAFENWVHHELSCYNEYAERFANLSYWRLATGHEVDFVVNSAAVAIEAKAVRKVTSDHTRGLRELLVDHPEVGKRAIVCLEEKPRLLPEGIEVLPVAEFVRQLWGGELF